MTGVHTWLRRICSTVTISRWPSRHTASNLPSDRAVNEVASTTDAASVESVVSGSAAHPAAQAHTVTPNTKTKRFMFNLTKEETRIPTRHACQCSRVAQESKKFPLK